jgi:hypothetical protein
MLSIPSLIPPSGHNATSPLPTPWQSVGADGVRNLASKLLFALFPPTTPFFRLKFDRGEAEKQFMESQEIPEGEEPDRQRIAEQLDAELFQIEQDLIEIENRVHDDFETGTSRSTWFEEIRHLLVAGNVLNWEEKDGTTRMYPLPSYVVRRAGGKVIELVVREAVSPDAFPPEHQKAAAAAVADQTMKSLDVFRVALRTPSGKYLLRQEARLKGKVITMFPWGTAPLDEEDVPFDALRLTVVDGEDYGRGLLEDYLGDLESLDGLTQALVEGAANAARVVHMVNPNSSFGTSITELHKIPNGGYTFGHRDDVTTLSLDKAQDFQTAFNMVGVITARLQSAFLLTASIQRQAERVTAEEIRRVAQELEDTLGGVYSSLSSTFQLPLVRRRINRMKRQELLPPLDEKLFKPQVVTGVEALGRGQELGRLQTVFGILQAALGPEFVSQNFDGPRVAQAIATGAGTDVTPLLKTDAEKQQIAQEQQQAQLAAMAQSAAGPVAGQLAKAVTNQAPGPQP